MPNLAARLMSVAQPGQVLVDGRLGGMRGLQWRDEASALLLSPQLGAIELTQLGYLQVKVGGWVGEWVGRMECRCHCSVLGGAAWQLRAATHLERGSQRGGMAGKPAPTHCPAWYALPSLHFLPAPSPQGLDDPKLVFQALPATLRGRQYADLPTSTHPAAAGAHPRHNSRTSLRRLGSVDTGLEATPRQVGGFAVDGCVGG